MTDPQRPMTLGERRVRVDFNPSQEGIVADIKRHTAAIIDLVNKIKDNYPKDAEVHRLISLAQTHYEDAAMWAVKAATAQK